MLDTIPPEILSLIAFHLTLPTLVPPVSLLQTCKPIHEAIAPSSNPRLYARVFRAKFDVAATERRLGELHAADLTAELRVRIKVLYRIRKMVKEKDARTATAEDLWMIFILLIENDGKNMEHLQTPDSFVDLLSFVQLYHEQHLLEAAVEPGYLKETNSRSLIMWIAWLLTGHGGHDETDSQRDERLFVLRPYVFASHQYELSFAPWTIPQIPLIDFAPHHHSTNPFIADLNPKSRCNKIAYYGRTLEISYPMLTLAAILRFFTKSAVASTAPTARFAALGGSPDQSPVDNVEEYDSPSLDLISDSHNHDRDFERLRSCYDPFTCKGMGPASWRNAWDGCWEGTFAFYDFDAFREMLAGSAEALFRGQFGEQHQVWRLKETWIVRKDWAEKLFAQNDDDVKQDVEGKQRGLPLTGPATNAGFPTDIPSSTEAGLDTPTAESITMNKMITQQIEAIEGYTVCPEEHLDEILGSGKDVGLEMLLNGVGHSAWGRFTLKGRVRAWDGMATLVKEYAPDLRGKWVYRGYVIAGDIFVGRWRDTFTPEEYVGYEGTFVLNRRR